MIQIIIIVYNSISNNNDDNDDNDNDENNIGEPQGSFFLCAVVGTKNCSNCPKRYLAKSQSLRILFAGDLWPTQ